MWLVMLDVVVSVCRSRFENVGCLEYKIRGYFGKNSI